MCLGRKFWRLTVWLLAVVAVTPSFAGEFAPPPLMLANEYRDSVSLSDYWVSEKFDGVRAYWDGNKLLTRGGERIAAPAWFTENWPDEPLDGELWLAHGQFSRVVSIIRQQPPDDEAWHQLSFMAFDLPGNADVFDERNRALEQLVARLDQPWVKPVKQFKVAHERDLKRELKRVVQSGGEGLMLHRGSSFYHAARSDDLLKLKPFQDAEARVVAHLPGKGKHRGRMGALLVETPEKVRFHLGAGFSDAERRNPPPLGSLVTYRYNGVIEKTKVPRFARYLRVRTDALN